MSLKKFIAEKIAELSEDIHPVDGDDGGKIKVAGSPVAPHEVKKMIAQGKGLRILVGAGKFRNVLLVWVGDGNSNVGAMHDTVAQQFGMSMHGQRHVPLEMTPQGKLRVTTTTQETALEGKRDIEDVLDRNAEYRSIFGTAKVDYSALTDAW